ALKQNERRGQVALGGRPIPASDAPGQMLAWLASVQGNAVRKISEVAARDWRMFRGDERRNAPGSGGSPYLNRGWRASTVEGSTSSHEHDDAIVRIIQDRRIPAGSGAANGSSPRRGAEAGDGAAVNGESASAPLLPFLEPLVVDDLVIVR